MLIDCQRGGGGRGGSRGIFFFKFLIIKHVSVIYILGSSGSRTYYHTSSSSCTNSECRSNLVMIVSIIFGVAFGICLLCVILPTIYIHCIRGQPFRNNLSFVSTKNFKIYNIQPFQSGTWLSRYRQFRKWHEPYQLSLLFHPQSMTVTGSGFDDVGKYTIDGIYSIETSRIALIKTYEIGTGNPSENLGHQVTIQLTWNTKASQFEGKWYVNIRKYSNEGKFELKLYGQEQFFTIPI